MITIRCDYQQLHSVAPDGRTWVVADNADYVRLRQDLRRALDDHYHDYTVYVRSRTLARWLNDLRDYGPDVVRWIEISAREQFQQQFGFAAPIELTDAAIMELRLLDAPMPTENNGKDAVGWILGQQLHSLWATRSPYKGHLADFAAWALQAGDIPPCLLALAEGRLAHWSHADKRYAFFLERAWRDASTNIFLRWALRSYPATFELRRQLESTPMEECGKFSQLCCVLLESRKAELTSFWNSWLARDNSGNIAQAIGWMSGLSLAELNLFEEWSRRNPSKLNETLISEARHRFIDLPQAAEILRRVERRIPPPQPASPQLDWTVSDWLNWATEEYMPYFSWVVENNQPREVQISAASQYSDWLVDAYPKLLFNADSPIVTNQYRWITKLLRDGYVDTVFWLIADGLTWWQARILYGLCADAGLGVTEMRPTIAALPSVTFISKRALVTAVLDGSVSTRSIAQELGVHLANDGFSSHIYTQHHELEAALGSSLAPGVYALFYNAIDHQSHTAQGFTDDRSFRGHLELLADLAQRALQESRRQGLRALAFVSSDHGSTLLPKSFTPLKVPTFAHEVEDEDEDTYGASIGRSREVKATARTRTCTLDKNASSLSSSERQGLEKSWYILPKEVFGLSQDFLIPQGYSPVARKPSGWTHGGATPEETVTAFLQIEPEAVDVFAPALFILGHLLPSQEAELEVNLVNSNQVPLERIRLRLSTVGADISVARLEAASQHQTRVTARAASATGATEAVDWVLTCDSGGHERHFSGRVEVPIRRMQTSDLDEWFEELK